MLSIETVQTCIGGQREGRCLNTTAFPVDMRCLTTIMMFILYPVRKLTTINNARAIFLMELKEKTFIDISSHIIDTTVDETRTTSRPKLIFPSLLMRLFRAKGVEIPQDISPMPTPSTINKLTIISLQVRLPSDEEEGDQGEGDPMETETVAGGQTSTSRSQGKRDRASTSSNVPPDAFQIILERSRMSILIGWQQFRIKSTYFQPSLIASTPSSDPLAISVKKEENFLGAALKGECHFEGEHAINSVFSLCFNFTLCFLW